jgi:hypothetical protein
VHEEEWEAGSEKDFDTTSSNLPPSNSLKPFDKTSTRRISVTSFSFSKQGRVTLKELFKNGLKALIKI